MPMEPGPERSTLALCPEISFTHKICEKNHIHENVNFMKSFVNQHKPLLCVQSNFVEIYMNFFIQIQS